MLFKDAGSSADGRLRLDLEPGNSDAFQESSSRSSNGWRKRNGKEGDADEETERRREEGRLANRPRKFVVLKLVDLGVNSTQGDGEGSAGRGDNYLSLLAYEADQIDTSVVVRNTNIRSEVAEAMAAASTASKKWVNGSKGAFELLYKQAEGTVIAIMNPKVLRPFAAGTKGTPETKMLRLTPRSAEDCVIIGQAADYRRCSSMKANGQRCSNFVDIKARKQTRTTTCDFHLSKHMDELARGRPEFAANSTTRLGMAGAGKGGSSAGGGGGGYGGGSSSAFPGRRGASHAGEESAINNITTTYKTATSNPFARAALSKKLNSSFGTVGEGMDNNGGNVFVSQSPIVAEVGQDEEVRASDPSSWKYDVSGRYGRGNTEKQTRLKKQIEEEQLMRKIEARFAPPSSKPSQSSKDGEKAQGDAKEKSKKAETPVLPVLPNGSADMINAAYSTLDQRKRVAQQKKDASDAKRRKYTGVVASNSKKDTADADAESSKLKFMALAGNKRSSGSSNVGLSVGALPIAGLSRHTAEADPSSSQRRSANGDSRSKLLSLAQNAPSASSASNLTAPSLRIKKAHRPKLRLPSEEVGRVSKLKVVGGELVNLDDFDDDAWEDDLGDLVTPSSRNEEEGEEVGLGDRILQLQSQSQARRDHVAANEDDEDSDLEII